MRREVAMRPALAPSPMRPSRESVCDSNHRGVCFLAILLRDPSRARFVFAFAHPERACGPPDICLALRAPAVALRGHRDRYLTVGNVEL